MKDKLEARDAKPHDRIKAAIKEAKACNAHKNEGWMTRAICNDIAVEHNIKQLVCTDRDKGIFSGETQRKRVEF